jgi:4-hydroxybenzoate polyprenyltransferase
MTEIGMKDSVRAYIEILRPGWWLACFFIGLTPGMLAIFWDTGSLNEFFQFKTMMWAFAYWASIVGIYVLNDIVGIKEDEVVNPKRPMPSSMISKKGAAVYSGVLLALGIGIWWFTFNNIISSLIQLSCIGLIIIYSAFYKHNILLGLGAGLIPVGIWIAFAPFHYITLALFLIVFFWELTLDVPENLLHYDGDILVHPQTFAVSMGKERFAKIGIVFALPTVLASLWLFVLLGLSPIYIGFALLAGIILMLGILSIRKNLKPIQLGKALGMSMLFIFIINIGIISHTLFYAL